MNYLQEELYKKVREDNQIFDFVQSGSLDGMWYWDLENPENEWMSPNFWETLGFDPAEKNHRAEEWQNLINPIDLDTVLENFERHCADPSYPYDQIVRYSHRDGSTVWIRCRGIAIRDDNGKPIRMLGAHTDITMQKVHEEAYELERRYNQELKRMQANFKYLAEHDTLTGLPNRNLFIEHLKQSIALARRTEKNLVLFFVDVDDFKQINDCYGHTAGDLVLKELALRLKENTRESDFCARLGGDEFVVLVEEVSEVYQSIQLAPPLLNSMCEPIAINDSTIKVTVSIGVANFPECASDVDGLLQCADIAMYQAKQLGRNQFRLYSSDLHQKVMRVQYLKQGLADAKRDKQFHLEYQPIYDSSGSIEGFEALLRWQFGEETVSPSEFIAVAEEHGFIDVVGDWVIKAAVAELAQWTRNNRFDGYMSINLSLLQLLDIDFPERLNGLTRMCDVDPSRIHLEITETQLADNITIYSEALDQLIRSGFSISLDDFGTGYASFNHLQRLPLSTLKIDQSFLEGVPANQKKSLTIDTMISMAKIMNLSVIVEGVETREQSLWLHNYPCSQQGFYHAYPHGSQRAINLLER